jgi:ankyrin repeat protein
MVPTTIKTQDDTSRVPTASLQALTIASSPPPKLSFAERLAAKRKQEERNQKLFRAVSLNKIDSVRELLELGADPNVLGKRQDTNIEVYPIYMAATNKFNEVLSLLVKHKAKVDITTLYSGTALYGAIENKNQEGVEILLGGGADSNKINTNGYSPLAYAAQFSDRDSSILDALLLMDADVNLKSPCGTPLDCALRQSQFRTARVLLNASADPNLVEDHLQFKFKNVPE